MKTMLTKMMKIAAAITVAAGATLSVYAEAVTDTNDVTAVVVGWQRAQEALGEQLTAAPASVREYSGLGGTGTYYVVSLEGGGYVVTSGDTSLEPVLAYSKTGTWVDDVKRNPLMAMLEIDIAAAAALETASVQQQGDDAATQTGGRRLAATASVQQQEGSADTMAAQRESNAAKWAKYKAGASQKGGIRLGASAPSSDLRVAALLQSAWSQSGNGENYYTPGASAAGNPGFVCGCVATMCAQIMRYWEWPKGTNITAIANYTGTVTYGKDDAAVSTEWDLEGGYYRTKTATTKTSWTSYSWPVFGGTYDWANMPLTFTYGTTTAQKKAIGHLTRDCGIACGMNYADGGSGAPGPAFAHRAVDQFAYTSGKCVNGWSDANRDALLASLDAGIPCGFCIYGDGGHAVVADGYGYSGGTLYIHFNYGWGSTGPSDWYTPPNVGTFTSVGEIIFNVYPPSVSKHDLTIVSGRVLSGTTAQSSVTVTATNRETGFSTNVTSNSKGIYSFMLPRGYYTFTATKSGSSAKVEADVTPCIAGTASNAKSGNIHGLDLNLGTAVTTPSVALTHRWSFNDNLNDSVGSSNASKIGSNVNLVDGKAVCTGNGAGQGSLNLGSNLLNTDGATIEIWAANDEVKGGSRIFEYGVDTSHYFMMAWTKSTDLYVDSAEAFSGSNNIYDGALAPFTLGRQYHISVTFERQGDGSTKVRAMRRDAASGAIQRVAVYSIANGIHTFSSPILRLGRSFQGNADAKATYDEVRVWQGVLSDAQLKASALAGPDANLSTLPWNASAVRYVAKAVWQGGATAPTAVSLANSANWSCTDQDGDAITGVPDHRSVVIIPNGTTAFTIPEGFTPNWRKLQIGSEGKATAQWGKKTYTQTSVSAQLDPSSADYTLQGDANVDELARVVAPSVLDAPAGLAGNQFRYDGWVYVTAAQAGRWAVSAYADDYAAFRLDDEWLAFTRVMDDGIRTAVADVPKGWHRFTVIIGDYYGGFGGCAMTTDYSRAVPVLVSIDGGNGIAFTSSNFQFGSPDRAAPVVTLAGDADWSSIGEVSLDSGAELDLNGHTLTIDKMDSSFLGANIKDTSATPGTIAFAEGGAVNSGNITVQGNVKTAYANAEARITAEATFWLDASDMSTITTNASGEVTQWNSRVGSNYAKQSTGYATLDYPTYDTTTYGIPTVDFGAAKSGKDLRFNVDVSGIRTVFWVTKIQRSADAFWLGLISGTGSDYPFSRGEAGQYTSNYSGEKFAKFWNGTDEVSDMLTECPPDDQFIVIAAEMKEGGATANSITQDRWNIRNGGKQLSELIVFNRVLSDEERNEVTQYLQTKWFGERSVLDDAIFWLDASDVSTITTNTSGEVTRWNSRVGSNYATQGRNYFAGSAFLYPTYDATTYGIPTVDFGNAVQSGWDNSNPGRDLNINTPVAVKTVFFVTRIQNDGKAAWLGQEDAIGTSGNCFRRDENGAYNDKRSGQPGQSRFANFWIGTDVISDMTTEHPPADRFCVFSAQMDDSAIYTAEHLAAQCGGLHSGGKQLSELIIFNRALSDEERTEVTQYLQNKWINSRSAELVHRWSFTSDYTDSVGTSHGFTQRWPNTGSADHPTDNCNVSVSDGQAVLVGGNGAGYLNLGTGVVESDDATLEVWVTPGVQPNWAYMFAYGICDVKSGQNGATANDYNGFFSCSWGRGGTSANDNMARNEFSMRYNGTSYVNDQQNWGPFVPGVTYHISITFRKDGNNTIVRWMSRNATTGAIMSERTVTATGWTAAQAATEGWYLTLGHNPWCNGNQDSVATYDEVRVWNGILSDDQLQANVLQGPDKIVGGGMENVVIEADRVFDVPTTGGYGYKTDLPVVIGAGAKIRFDTTDYFGKGLRFKAGGITVPSGNVLDCVELSDSDNYTATMEDANTILVQLKSTIPYESTWTGGAPSSAADFSNAANWASVNAAGAAISAVPTAKTTVVIPAASLASFSVPAGASLGGGRVLFGGRTPTKKGKRSGSPSNLSKDVWIDRALSDYGSIVDAELTHIYRTSSAGNSPSDMATSILRFDGWVYVDASKAGYWKLTYNFDDVLTFSLDGDLIIAHPTYRYARTSGCYVSEGWHRFTCLAGDTSGGYGAQQVLGSMKYPFVISVNGGSDIAFDSNNFTFGTDSGTVTLTGDANWCALGEIMLNSGLTIDLNGHNLSVAEIDSDVLGAVIKNTSGTASTLTTYTGTVGSGVVTDNITVSKVAVATATWTGAAGDNDVKTPGNWNCYDSSSNLLPGAIPTTDTTVTISDAPEAIASSEVAPDWKWLDLGTVANKTGTLTFNSGSTFSLPLTSNRGLQMGTVANSAGILNVNGGNVTLGNINAPSANVASTVEVNVSAGKLLVSGWVDFGNNENCKATFNQTGGEIETKGAFWFGRQRSSTATFNMRNGTFKTSGGSFHIGQTGNATGIFNQYGGSLQINNDFTLGVDNGAAGKFHLFGGIVTSAVDINLPYRGRGEFNVGGTLTSASGKGFYFGNNSYGKGELRLRNGGTLSTQFLKKGNSAAQAGLALGAGTLKATAADATFVSGLNGLVFDPGTLTLNSDYAVTISGNAETHASAGARIAKTGTGTVTIDRLPPVDDFAVNAGMVALSADNASARSAVNAASGNEYPASPSATLLANNYLLHRWDFNGHGLDLVGTNHASIVGKSGAIVYNSASEIQIPGGNRGIGYLDCGSNIIPAELGDTPFTIEFWAKPKSNVSWAQWFAFGNSSDANGTGGALTGLIIAPKSGAGSYPSFRMVGAQTSNNIAVGSGNLTLDKEYHVALVVKPTGNNTATVTAYIEDPSGGEAIRVKSESVTKWSTATIVQKNFWLGHSHWNDKDVYSTYNEVRVWAAALSQEQIVANGTLGPDVLPVLSATSTLGVTENITVASGATLDLGGHTLTQPRLAGTGTVQNGTLNVGTLAPGGDGTSGAIALNVSSVSGVIRIDNGDTFTTTTTGLDLSGATIDLAEAPARSFVVGTASGSGSFATGRPALTVNGAPLKGWMVKRSGNTLKVSKGGVMILAK